MFIGFLIGVLVGGIVGALTMACTRISGDISQREYCNELCQAVDNELQEILNYADKKITLFELKNIIHKLKKSCAQAQVNIRDENIIKFYTGEMNAFQICLDLLDHLWMGGN